MGLQICTFMLLFNVVHKLSNLAEVVWVGVLSLYYIEWSLFFSQCVFTVDKKRGLILTEIADGVDVQDVVEATGCEFEVRGHPFMGHGL